MGLRSDYVTEHLGQPVTVPGAYWRIAMLQGNARLMSAELHVYHQAEDVGTKAPLATQWVHFQPDLDAAGNLFQQGYVAIKARPEFAEATDA